MVDYDGYKFPDCVWEQTPKGGWASRPLTDEDDDRRWEVVQTLRSVKHEDQG